MTLTRRTILGALTASFMTPAMAATQNLKILNWRHYGTDEAWANSAFEAKTGLGLNHDYYASADEALERLAKNADNYDVVILNAAHIPYAVSRGLLEKIPSDAVRNFDDIAEPLQRHRFLTVDGELYGVAWTWGMTGLSRGISKSAPPAVHWSDLWDTKFKGRVGIRDNAIDAVEIAALSLGLDPASLQDFAGIETHLSALAGQVGYLWDGEDSWNKAFAEHKFELAVNWSTAAARAQRFFQLPVTFLEPADGTIGWFDCLALPVNSTQRDGALALINYLVSDDFLVEWATRIGAPAPSNLSALRKLAEDDPTRVIHRPELLSKLKFLDAPSEAFRSTATEIWSRVAPVLRN